MSDQILRPQSKLHRRRYIIYPKFQLTLIGIQSFILVLGFGFMWGHIHYSYMKLKDMGGAAKLPAAHPYFKFIEYQEWHTLKYVLVAFAITFILSTILNILISHKLAGPLVRLKNDLQEIIKTSNYKPIKFREKDFLSDLAPIIGLALETMNKQTRKTKEEDVA